MDSYLMMLYVSIEQETAMMKLFSDNGWKYCKPDLLQLTDKLGGVKASYESNKAIDTKNTTITSLSEYTEASITSPLRPGTRSQKSRIRVPVSALETKTNKRKASRLEEKIEPFNTENIQAMKEDSREVVDDDDFNDYMEYGDEDDDYIDDDEKEVKRKQRRFTRSSAESDHSVTEREEVTAKLDGTEDSDPEDLTIMSNGEENSTDDDGSETNTDNSLNIVPAAALNPEPTVKVIAASRVTGKRKKRPKLDESTMPIQYQCGLCKVKYLDKKDLNKHLTDKVCLGDIEEVVAKVGDNEVDFGAENEQGFENILLTEAEKIGQIPELMISEGQMDDLEDNENKSVSAEVTEKGEIKSEKNFYQCDKCDLAYKTAYNLKTHQVMKHGLKLNESVECNICSLSYGSKHILSLHKLDKHGLTGDPSCNVECEECKMMCDDYMSYKLHKKRVHNIMVFTELNRKYICPTCGKAFTRRDSMKSHCEIIHLGTKPRKQKPQPTERKHICDFCGKAFLRRNNLSEHISVKHKDTAKKYKCEECGETFLRPYALEYHTNKKHLHKKPYECDKCHKAYFSAINLRQHKEHCYKEEEEKEACPYCDKRFVHKRNLSMHLEAIHTDSPLTCECGYVIKWRSSIAKHRRKCPLLQLDKAENNSRDVFIKSEIGDTMNTNTIEEMSGLELSNAEGSVDTGFTTIATDSGEQVISNEIAQALKEQGLLVDGAVSGTLKMEEGKAVVDEDPSVQSVYYSEGEDLETREGDILPEYSKELRNGGVTRFNTENGQSQISCSSTTKHISVTEGELNDATNLNVNRIVSSETISDQEIDIQKSQGQCSVPVQCAVPVHIAKSQFLTDAWCIEKDKGTSTVKSLRPKRPFRMKVTSEIEKKLKRFTCEECGKVYLQKSSWKRHTKSHKPGLEYCSPCHMYFDTAGLLEAHKSKIHSASFVCMLCRSEFARKSCLRKHMLTIHPEHCNAKFKCPDCNCKAVFDNEEHFQDHLNIHEGQTPYKCSQCEKSVSTKSSLKLHESSHNSNNLLQCKDCEREFKSLGALHNHRASVHEKKRFKCDQCKKVFIYRSGFCKHLLSHKKESSERKSPLTCSIISETSSENNEELKTLKILEDSNLTEDETGLGTDSEGNGQNVQIISNQACQMEIAGNQSNENINQVETVINGLPGMGMSQLQTSMLGGQEVTVLPLSTVQLDPSSRIMWICRT